MISFEKFKLRELICVLTDYHANGSYEKLKEKVKLLDKSGYAIMIRTTNFEQDNFSDFKYISEEAYNFLEKSKVFEGDILMNKIANAGSVYYMPKLPKPVSLAMNLFLIRLNKEIANPKYTYLYLQHNEEYIKSFAAGSVTKTITKEAVKDLDIYLPKLDIQNNVVEVVSSLDDKIELNRQMSQTLEEMAKTLFEKYFVVGTDEANLPEGWRAGTLGEITRNVRNGVSINNLKDEIAYIGLEHLPRKSLTLNEIGTATGLMSSKLTFKEDQILFGKLRPYFHKVILSPLSGVCSTDILVLEPIQLDFLSFCLFHLYSDALIDYSSKISAGTRMPRADWKGLSSYKIIIPPVSVAKEFNSKAYPMLSKIKCTFSENLALTQIRDTLLPKLLSGELDIRALNTDRDLNPVSVTTDLNHLIHEQIFS